MSRKTVSVEWLKDRVNRALEVEAPSTFLSDKTAQDAWKYAMATLLEDVLLSTGNYEGFSYNKVDHSGELPVILDETSRRYL